MKVSCYNIFLIPITPLSPHLWPQSRALPFVLGARNPASLPVTTVPATCICCHSSCHVSLLPKFLPRLHIAFWLWISLIFSGDVSVPRGCTRDGNRNMSVPPVVIRENMKWPAGAIFPLLQHTIYIGIDCLWVISGPSKRFFL